MMHVAVDMDAIANFWSPGTVMENTLKKDYVVAAIMGRDVLGS